MTRIIRVYGEKDGAWVFCADEADAMARAIKARLVRDPAKARLIDQTESYADPAHAYHTSSRKAFEANARGFAAVCIQSSDGVGWVVDGKLYPQDPEPEAILRRRPDHDLQDLLQDIGRKRVRQARDGDDSPSGPGRR